MISKISEKILHLAQTEEIEGEFASMRRPVVIAVIRDILLYLRIFDILFQYTLYYPKNDVVKIILGI